MGSSSLPFRFRLLLALLLGAAVGTPGAPPVSGEAAGAAICSELLLGAVIGLGLTAICSGLRLAGEVLDQHLGWGEALAGTGVAGDGAPLSPAARMLAWLGVMVVLSGPWPREGALFACALEGLRTVPPGSWTTPPSLPWAIAPVQIAGELAIRVLAPLLAILSLVGWAQGLIHRLSPLSGGVALASAVRPLLALYVLAATFAGAADQLAAWLRIWMAQLSAAGQ
jgi:flagellar biosynthesis protein FliR